MFNHVQPEGAPYFWGRGEVSVFSCCVLRLFYSCGLLVGWCEAPKQEVNLFMSKQVKTQHDGPKAKGGKGARGVTGHLGSDVQTRLMRAASLASRWGDRKPKPPFYRKASGFKVTPRSKTDLE